MVAARTHVTNKELVDWRYYFVSPQRELGGELVEWRSYFVSPQRELGGELAVPNSPCANSPTTGPTTASPNLPPELAEPATTADWEPQDSPARYTPSGR